MMIDPGVITLIQNTFLQHVQDAFASVSHYARNLLYIFAGIELVLFGLIWALQQGGEWERLFFKVLKIGLILFIIQNYTYLFNIIIQSFVDVGSSIVTVSNLSQVIFNPAHIWQFGYNIGLNLIKAATLSNGIGIILVLLILGIGILLTFGLLGIQIVLQMVGFYVIALISLIFLPFGVFEPSAGMFEKSIQSVLKAGVRVMVLMMVIGIALVTWNILGLTRITAPYNINVPLGLFFSSLLFLYLSIKLPKMAAHVVGEISSRFLPEKPKEIPSAQLFQSPIAGMATAPLFDFASVQAATTVSPTLGQIPVSSTIAAAAQVSSGTAATQAPSISLISQPMTSRQRPDQDMGKASQTSRHSISESQLKQIRKTILETLEGGK
ncbi:MAG: type IV secretion system protein [Gammaproteobacteria bacterium]|nr:type IV secretion system protein [Gammaproteobacteria bacterium]